MKPPCTGMLSPGSSLSTTLQALCPIFLSQSGSASSQNTREQRGGGGKPANVAPFPNFRNNSALWTSVPVCIMDDIAEGPRYREGLGARKR